MVHTCHRNPFKHDIGEVIFGKYNFCDLAREMWTPNQPALHYHVIHRILVFCAHINYNGTIVPREGQANINACNIANYRRVNTGRSNGLWNRGW